MIEVAIILALCLGFTLGVITCKLRASRPMGRIIMHRTDDPDVGPYLAVELYDRPEALYGHKQVLFDVSQK